jgi:hypothetical protein
MSFARPSEARAPVVERASALRAAARAVASWDADFIVLASLLALTAVFGRPFSKIGFAPLHLFVTEGAILAAAILALRRSGVRHAVERVRSALPGWALLAFWLAGAIAAIRGLFGFGLSDVSHDIGLVEYSILVPLVVVIADTPTKAAHLIRVLSVAGLGAAFVYAILYLSSQNTIAGSINPSPAVGIYISLYALLLLARLTHRLWVRPIDIVAGAAALTLVVLTAQRSVLLAFLVVVIAIALLSPRIPSSLALTGTAFIVAVVAALGIESAGIGSPGADVGGAAQQFASARAHPNYIADDGISEVQSADVVQGDAAAGHLSRQVQTGQSFEIAHVTGLRRGQTYTVSFSVKPLSPVTTHGRVGDTSGLGWGEKSWVAAPRVEWQQVQRTLIATKPDERLVLLVDSGSSRVRLDALRLVIGITPAPGAARPTKKVRSPRHVATTTAAAKPSRVAVIPTTKKPGRVVVIPTTTSSRPIVTTVQHTFSGNGTTMDVANQQWRLAFWSYMLRAAAHQPIFGVGFGRPANFHWHGVVYDARIGDVHNDQDVTGPHNSFVNIVYRTGLLGFIPLLFLVAAAVVAALSWLRRPHESEIRAAYVGLVAIFVFVFVIANLNVALEGPYMAIFFWSLLGLLIAWPQLYPGARGNSTPSDGGPSAHVRS